MSHIDKLTGQWSNQRTDSHTLSQLSVARCSLRLRLSVKLVVVGIRGNEAYFATDERDGTPKKRPSFLIESTLCLDSFIVGVLMVCLA